MDILSKIAILLARVLLGMDSIQAALLKLVDAMDATAIETQPKLIERTVLNTQLRVQHPTQGFPGVLAAIAELRDYITTQDSGLLAAIGGLPTPPPPAPSSGDNAEAVWAYMWDSSHQTGLQLSRLYQNWEHYRSLGGMPVKANSWFGVWWPVSIID